MSIQKTMGFPWRKGFSVTVPPLVIFFRRWGFAALPVGIHVDGSCLKHVWDATSHEKSTSCYTPEGHGSLGNDVLNVLISGVTPIAPHGVKKLEWDPDLPDAASPPSLQRKKASGDPAGGLFCESALFAHGRARRGIGFDIKVDTLDARDTA